MRFDQFSQAVAKVIALTEVRERLTALGLAVEYMTPTQLASRERAYAKRIGNSNALFLTVAGPGPALDALGAATEVGGGR